MSRTHFPVLETLAVDQYHIYGDTHGGLTRRHLISAMLQLSYRWVSLHSQTMVTAIIIYGWYVVNILLISWLMMMVFIWLMMVNNILVDGAMCPSWKIWVRESQWEGWHPIYEMENNLAMFETTNQDLLCYHIRSYILVAIWLKTWPYERITERWWIKLWFTDKKW
jgi:hypothetical protein